MSSKKFSVSKSVYDPKKLVSQSLEGHILHLSWLNPSNEFQYSQISMNNIQSVDRSPVNEQDIRQDITFANPQNELDLEYVMIQFQSNKSIFILIILKNGNEQTFESTSESFDDWASLQDKVRLLQDRNGEILEEAKVLGQGGFGCVVYPALVLPESSVVGPSNRFEQATKIGAQRDMLEEYDLSEFIRNSVKDDTVGVFASEVTCGVNQGDLGLYADEIVDRCSRITGSLRRTPVSRTFQRLPKKSRSKSRRFRLSPKKKFQQSRSFSLPQQFQSLSKSKSLRAGVQSPKALCAIQYPRYRLDFFAITREVQSGSVKLSENLADFMVDTLRDKLKKLHSHNIVHLDIKGGNLASMVSYSNFREDASLYRLADFGNAEVVNKKSYKKIYNTVFFGKYADYLKQLTPEFYTFMDEKSKFLSPEQQFQCGFWVDESCLYSALKKLYIGKSEKIETYIQELRTRIQKTFSKRTEISVYFNDNLVEKIPQDQLKEWINRNYNTYRSNIQIQYTQLKDKQRTGLFKTVDQSKINQQREVKQLEAATLSETPEELEATLKKFIQKNELTRLYRGPYSFALK